ncbi:MAG TPA: GtrA family protein [Candidatus Acidoferrales bacterium]|nr:GtrA family protein [Candidatus Acidoferrales bacterium]
MSAWGERARRTARRWIKFNAVGAMGICVQMIAVYVLGTALGANSLAATALAVEAAVLHNFVWHEHLTWRDRKAKTRMHLLLRLATFNATTGAISIGGNLAVVWLLMSEAHVTLVVANLCAVAACSIVNFVVSDRIVFRGVSRTASAQDAC